MPGIIPQAVIAGITSANSAWSYIKGQCTYYAAQAANWIPAGLGNAADWLHNAQLKGYHTTMTPTIGSVVVYGRGHGYDPANGHVAVVESVSADLKSFTVGEQNFDERGSIRHGRVSSMSDVLGFILPPGTSATSTPGGPAAGNANLNPLDIPGAIGNGVAAIGKVLTQGVFMLAGIALIVLGLIILIAREFLHVQKPSVGVGTPQVKLRVLTGGSGKQAKKGSAAKPAAKPAAPAAEPSIEETYEKTGELP